MAALLLPTLTPAQPARVTSSAPVGVHRPSTPLRQGDFTYVINAGSATVIGYSGTNSAVTIPNTLGGTTVTGIRFDAFRNLTTLVSVNLPAGIAFIGDQMNGSPFDGCTNLTSFTVNSSNPNFSSLDGVIFNKNQSRIELYPEGKSGGYTIPGTVTEIWFDAFANCVNLTELVIPASVTSFYDDQDFGYYLSGCNQLTLFTVDPLNPVFRSLDGVVFSKDLSSLVLFPPGRTGEYVVPYGVKTIGLDSFRSQTNLTSIIIPDTVITVGADAFDGCSSLHRVIMGNGVDKILDGAFAGCRNLAKIYFLGNSPSSVGTFAFYGDNLATVFYLPGASGWGPTFAALPTQAIISPGFNYFITQDGFIILTEYLGADTDVTVPDHIEDIPVIGVQGGTFRNSTNVLSVTFPDTVTAYGDFLNGIPFLDCSSLTRVTVGANNPEFSTVNGVVFNKTRTTLLYYPQGRTGPYLIPNSISAIGLNAFLNCAKLTSLTLPSTLTSINDDQVYGHPFRGCSSFETFIVDPFNPVYSSVDGVLFDKDRSGIAIYPPGRLGPYTVPDGVSDIGLDSFQYCKLLSSVATPNTLVRIDSEAFYGCSELDSISFGTNLDYIGPGSFVGCTNLSVIIFYGDVPSFVGPFAFYSVRNATVYYYPGTKGWSPFFEDFPTVELNTPPVLPSQPDVTIGELTPLIITNTATELTAQSTLGYTLINPPAGATIDASGVIKWTPSEAQGPGTYTITTLVTNNDLYDILNPELSATNSFVVTVREVNTPPLLAPLTKTNFTIRPGITLYVTNVATDVDLPSQKLTYHLLAAPAGASIDSAAGIFSWRPTLKQAPSTNLISVTVSDDGTPTLSATQTFQVTVIPIIPPRIESITIAKSYPVLTISGESSADYIILVSTNLTDWRPAATNSPPTVPFQWPDTPQTTAFPYRFYQINMQPK